MSRAMIKYNRPCLGMSDPSVKQTAKKLSVWGNLPDFEGFMLLFHSRGALW